MLTTWHLFYFVCKEEFKSIEIDDDVTEIARRADEEDEMVFI